jgi:hypothetical protein
MHADQLINLADAVGEWLIAIVIYWEWQGTRLDRFLDDVTATQTFQLPTSRGRFDERFFNFSMYNVNTLWCNTGDAELKTSRK